MSDFINFSSDEDEESDLEYIYNMGLSHEKRGNPRDAVFYFNKVLDVKPEHIDALEHKGNALGNLGKHDRAIICYDIVLQTKPDHIECILNKGLALRHLGKHDQALACYDKILEKTPNDASVLYHKSCIKALQNDIEPALTLLEKAIILESEYAKKASQDKDFVLLQDDARFKSLTM